MRKFTSIEEFECPVPLIKNSKRFNAMNNSNNDDLIDEYDIMEEDNSCTNNKMKGTIIKNFYKKKCFYFH